MRLIRFGVAPLVLASMLSTTPSLAADSFYQDLLAQGRAALTRGEFTAAAHDLRIACFGLLEEPTNLALGLTHLALAQHGAGDADDFNETTTRLLDLETRFSAYSKAAIDSATRAAFEQRLIETVPYEQLQRVPTFRTAARARREQEVRALPAERRRQALMSLIESAPDDDRWRTMLAELDLAAGRPAEARNALAALPELRANDAHARCLYGRAQAALGACTEAIVDLDACGDPATDAGLATDWVTCLTAAGDWQKAAAVLDTIPAAWRGRKPLRALDRQTRRTLKRLAVAKPPPAEIDALDAGEPATLPPVPDAEAAPTQAATQAAATRPVTTQAAATQPAIPAPPPPPAAPSVAAQIKAFRERFRATNEMAELEIILEAGTTLAANHPASSEAQFLVAEVAYRLRRWQDVIRYIQRGGVVLERPALQFYLAIALYETGDHAAAAPALSACLPQLQRTEFVRDYAQKILGNPQQ